MMHAKVDFRIRCSPIATFGVRERCKMLVVYVEMALRAP